MKLAFRQIEPFIKNPDPAARAILVYGPDSGLITERIALLGKHVIEDLNDPFQVSVLNAPDIIAEPARLIDEAAAQSLMGGDRLIRIRDAADSLTPVLKEYLENPSSHALVLVEGGELGPRSNLRKLFEGSKSAAALPCYVEDERNLGPLIQQAVKDAGLRIDREAQNLLSGLIVGDRAQARSEIDKLLLYKGSADDISGQMITVEDVRASIGAVRALSMDEFIHAAASGRLDETLCLYHTMLQEGVAVISLLRVLQNHFRRLYAVRIQLDDGMAIDAAMKTLNPEVFFKWAESFKSQVRKWNSESLLQVLDRIAEIESETKKTGTPVTPLCGDMLLKICKKAA